MSCVRLVKVFFKGERHESVAGLRDQLFFQTEWNEALKPKEYPIDVLRKKAEELPEDVDPTKKEVKYSLINEGI